MRAVLVQEIADDEVAVRVVKVADTVKRRNSERGRQRRSRGRDEDGREEEKVAYACWGFFFCGGGSDIVDRVFTTTGKECG